MQNLKNIASNIYLKLKEHINQTRILSILTAILIITTIFQIASTESIRKVETFVAQQGLKYELKAKISLADDLSQELSVNNEFYADFLKEYNIYINTTLMPNDLSSTIQLEKANEFLGFGTSEMRLQIKKHIAGINILKATFQRIQQSGNDLTSKNYNVDYAAKLMDALYRGGLDNSKEPVNATKVIISYMTSYKSELENELTEVDDKLIKDIQKLN